MDREQKAAVIDEIATQITESEAVFAVDYRGITVTQVGELRGTLRASDATFRVVKNTLTERAADQAGADGLKAVLEGPTAFAFVRGDAAATAKALSDFGRRSGLLAFKGGLLGGQVVDAGQISDIARLPSREVLLGQFVGTVAAPLTGLVRGLNALIGGLAIQLGAIAEQGLVGGGGGPAEAPPPAPAEVEAAPAPPTPDPDADEATAVGAETTSPDEAPASE